MQQVEDEDRAIASRLVDGDADAFETLYHRHTGIMTGFCAAIVGSPAVAADIVDETWLSVLSRIDLYEGHGSLANFIYTILINKAHSRLRQHGRSARFIEDAGDDILADAFDADGSWLTPPIAWERTMGKPHLAAPRLLGAVETAIEALPLAPRAAVLLQADSSLTTAEVCALLKIGETDRRLLVHRARLGVRGALDCRMRT